MLFGLDIVDEIETYFGGSPSMFESLIVPG